MQKWTSRIETPIKAELICYDVNGIHIVFGVTEENQLKLFHFCLLYTSPSPRD